MENLTRSLVRLPISLLRVLLYVFTLRFLVEVVQWLCRICALRRREKHLRHIRRGRPLRCAPRCAIVRPEVYRRADPLIYSQTYLMEQGLAVTWDNPDIQLYEAGVPVPSWQLQAGRPYEVEATIYNNSTDAPAVGLPVELWMRSFGVGNALTLVDTTTIDLPVKGSPNHPAKAKLPWTTPNAEGHYCLLVKLIWPDDANPKNNVGQENTNVGIAASPAVFRFPVRNEDTIRKHIRMAADAYTIPPRLPCSERPTKKQSDRQHPVAKRADVFVPPLEEAADWPLARVRHGPQAFPLPAGWSVEIRPMEFELDPGATEPVTVTITPPDSFRGERPFNVNAMYGAALLGGVTLTVKR
jgi:hypothetical protein